MSRTALMLSWTVCSKSSKLRFHDIPLYWKYTVSQKNAPTLASSSFDKHGLISIIFGKQRQHTFKNDMPMRVQLSLSLHVYLLYLLLNSCDGNDSFWLSSMLVKQSSSFSRKHRTLSPHICVRQTVRLTTEFVDWCIEHVYIVQTPVRDTSRCDHSDLKQRLIDTWEAYHKTSSLVNGDNDYLQAWDKGHHFEHLLN